MDPFLYGQGCFELCVKFPSKWRIGSGMFVYLGTDVISVLADSFVVLPGLLLAISTLLFSRHGQSNLCLNCNRGDIRATYTISSVDTNSRVRFSIFTPREKNAMTYWADSHLAQTSNLFSAPVTLQKPHMAPLYRESIMNQYRVHWKLTICLSVCDGSETRSRHANDERTWRL